LNRSAQRRKKQRVGPDTNQDEERPSVKELLEIDAEYRRRAKAGDLPQIAPRRFNPQKEAWLPILHTECGEAWNCTVLYSNTERAHELDKTHDWVVIYFERNGDEHQNTVVTETSGELKGKRVVRGREEECKEYYAARTG
jgi:putative hydrolase